MKNSIEKWRKDLDNSLCVCVVFKHMKRWLSPLIETRYQFLPMRMVKIKNYDNISSWQHWGKELGAYCGKREGRGKGERNGRCLRTTVGGTAAQANWAMKERIQLQTLRCGGERWKTVACEDYQPECGKDGSDLRIGYKEEKKSKIKRWHVTPQTGDLPWKLYCPWWGLFILFACLRVSLGD